MDSSADDLERASLASRAESGRARPTKMRFRWWRAIDSAGHFRCHGKRWYLSELDRNVGRFVDGLVWSRRDALAAGSPPLPLLYYRNDFRYIVRRRRIGGIVYQVWVHGDESETVRLSIWLMGRCQNRAAVPVILSYLDDPNAAIRREVARALRRLRSWAELSRLANDPDPRVRQFAKPIAPKPFEQRIAHLLPDRALSSAIPSPQKTPFFARLPIGPGRPPKPVEVIRAILHRIRRLVHGN